MNQLARGVYGIFGVLTLALGVAAVVRPSLAIPLDSYSALTSHLVREQGAHGVFIGLMSLWCMTHFTQRRLVHWYLLVFALLFSAIHWLEFFQHNRTLASPAVNTVPLLLFALTAPWTKARSDSGRDVTSGGV